MSKNAALGLQGLTCTQFSGMQVLRFLGMLRRWIFAFQAAQFCSEGL